MAQDGSFWHKLAEQQTTSTVGLGYVTTNTSDPSACYWPGPGLLPPFDLEREWITHHTALRFRASVTDSTTNHADVSLEEFAADIGHKHTHYESNNDLFSSDILITYKLKNPAQFLRDVFDASYLAEFHSRFAGRPKYHLMTGYKVSRNVQSAIDHQHANDESMHFTLSTKLAIPKKLLGKVNKNGVEGGYGHDVISTIQYRAPGDSIYYVRYLPIELVYSPYIKKRVMVIPSPPQSWNAWMLGGWATSQTRTIILPRSTAWRDDSIRMLATSDSIDAAVRRMRTLHRLQEVGRRSTAVSGDDATETNSSATPAETAARALVGLNVYC